MAGATIRLVPNVPITGTVEYCDYVKSKNAAPNGDPYPDQIALRGKWDGAGEGRIYLHLATEKDMTAAGMIGPRQSNGNYPLLIPSPKVKITKVDNGQKKFTTVEVEGCSSRAEKPATTLYQAPQQASPGIGSAPRNTNAGEISATYEECLKEAIRIGLKNGANTDRGFEHMAGAASTMFIERCRRGLFADETQEVPF